MHRSQQMAHGLVWPGKSGHFIGKQSRGCPAPRKKFLPVLFHLLICDHKPLHLPSYPQFSAVPGPLVPKGLHRCHMAPLASGLLDPTPFPKHLLCPGRCILLQQCLTPWQPLWWQRPTPTPPGAVAWGTGSGGNQLLASACFNKVAVLEAA